MLLTFEALLSLIIILSLLAGTFPLYAPVPEVLPVIRAYDYSTVAMELGAFDAWCSGARDFSGSVCVTRYYFCPDGRLYEINYCTD